MRLPTYDGFGLEVLRAAALRAPYDVNARMDSESGDHVVRVASGPTVIGEVRTTPRGQAMLSEGVAFVSIVQEVQDIVRRHEAVARIPAEQHKRLKAVALNRRKHLLAPIRERRAIQGA
jgi:hypothetical protein